MFAYLRQTDSSELVPAVLSVLATFDRAATHSRVIDLLSSAEKKVHSAAMPVGATVSTCESSAQSKAASGAEFSYLTCSEITIIVRLSEAVMVFVSLLSGPYDAYTSYPVLGVRPVKV